ncbi:MAG: inorganic phosphate transporter [Granulosicoccus sp.]
MTTIVSDVKDKVQANGSTYGSKSELVLPKFTIAGIFLAVVGMYALVTFGFSQIALIVGIASVAGGYMAINIGANDVANNVGPAVGSGALSLGGAIAIAIVFESAGALLAGGDVVSTISKGIVDASLIPDSTTFMLAMGSALLAGALWLNLATWVGAPVSTTHSIVGGVMGGGVAAAGINVIDWNVMSMIAASWVISPLLGGLIAAAFLAGIEKSVFSRHDMIAASRRWVPVFLGIMIAAFTMYLMMKGLKKIWKPGAWIIVGTGFFSFLLAQVVLRPVVSKASLSIENRRAGVNQLFNVPLIFSACLLSFSHGANDVANAVGPLSAIVSAASSSNIEAKVGIPLWVMVIGTIGISLGLFLFGAKLIRTVGKQLTSLDQSRAFCVCLSAAITVIGASALGLPVSSTHIAIGAVFGIGFYREMRCNAAHRSRTGLPDFAYRMIKRALPDKSSSGLRNSQRKPRKLVRRRHLLTILGAWFITVPSAAMISAGLFHLIQSISN